MDDLTPTTVRRIDYAETFRFMRLFTCFRMAVTPSRLVLALLFIVTAWLAGLILDTAWNHRVIVKRDGNAIVHYEWMQYRSLDAEGYGAWRERFSQSVPAESKEGVFQEVMRIQKDLFRNMVSATLGFRLGFDQFHPAAEIDERTVIGSVRLLTVTMPSWLWRTYPGFVVVYATILMALWALLGGAVSRQMVVGAAVDRVVPMSEAVAFAARRWLTYLMAPLFPLLFILGFAVVLGVFGCLYYIWGLNIIAGVLYVFPLAIGWVMALLLVLWFGGVHLIYPAVSAQGADALDAMARAFSYTMSRPWRLFFYSLVALLFGAATYLFVGMFIYLMIAMSHWGANLFGGLGGTFEAPNLGQWPGPAPGAEGARDKAAQIIHVWVYLTIAALGAYAISYYLAAYSQIYLLLRQYTDGDAPADIFEPEPPSPPSPSDKVEPAPPTPPSTAAPDTVEDKEAVET